MSNKLYEKIIMPMNKFAEEHDNLIWRCNLGLSILAVLLSTYCFIMK